MGLSPVQPGSVISDWREIKSSLDLVINFKFVSFATNLCNCAACMRPLLELTTQPQRDVCDSAQVSSCWLHAAAVPCLMRDLMLSVTYNP
jgi:hypothetical protein